MDFRSCLLDKKEVARHTVQALGVAGEVMPGTPLGIVTNALHTCQ